MEAEYISLVKQVIKNGRLRDNRTGEKSYSSFGYRMEFDLAEGFPLLTTKQMFWRGIVSELLWFLSGSTDARELNARGNKIWNANSSREFLDSIGFNDVEAGDLGPTYGFQWRHFGAQYKTARDQYDGIDQIARIIETIQKDPNNRRLILTAWNPADLPKCALPPCHILAQFYVDNGELSCQVYQRSADIGIGIPFNIASYALLLHIIAHCTNLRARRLLYVLGDAHIYESHIEPLNEQITREPKKAPCLVINTDNRDINKFSVDDFVIRDYCFHPKIIMKMF